MEIPIFTCPFAQVEGLLSPVKDDPLSQGALGGIPWPRATGLDGPEAAPASFTRPGPVIIRDDVY